MPKTPKCGLLWYEAFLITMSSNSYQWMVGPTLQIQFTKNGSHFSAIQAWHSLAPLSENWFYLWIPLHHGWSDDETRLSQEKLVQTPKAFFFCWGGGCMHALMGPLDWLPPSPSPLSPKQKGTRVTGINQTDLLLFDWFIERKKQLTVWTEINKLFHCLAWRFKPSVLYRLAKHASGGYYILDFLTIHQLHELEAPEEGEKVVEFEHFW